MGTLDARHRDIFDLLGVLGAASCQQLMTLYFRKVAPIRLHNPQDGSRKPRLGISRRSARARLAVQTRKGFFGIHEFWRGRGRVTTYHLTELGRAAYPDLARRLPRSEDCESLEFAMRGWVRSEFWCSAALSKEVKCNQSATARDYATTAWGNDIPKGVQLNYDIIYADKDGRRLAFMLLVDDMSVSPSKLVEGLPLHRPSGPEIPVLLRPLNDGSAWNSGRGEWVEGPRMRTLRTLLAETPQFKPWNPKIYREVGILKTAKTP